MEAVNNYVQGLQRTGSWNTGPTGFGQSSGGSGSIDFSVLLQTGSSVKEKDTSNNRAPVKVQDNKTGSYKSNNPGKESGKTETVTEDKKAPDTARAPKEEKEEVSARNSELDALMALMSNLQADRVTTDSGEVEVVTGKIVTEAEFPKVTSSEVNYVQTDTNPIVPEANRVPALGSETRTKNSAEAAKTFSLEEERNGSAYTAPEKVVDEVDAKYDPAEILKSLEGQGHIISNSTNSPTGKPAYDSDGFGPTGRAPDDIINREEIVNGPLVPEKEETKSKTDEETKNPMEGYEAINPAAPTPFANQTNQAVQTTVTKENINESMMMRTNETDMASDLTNLISARFPSQNGTLTIELDPENLGKITINVNYDSGHAAVSISATNQKTVEILTQNAPAMANIIEQKTGQQTEIYVPNTQESQTKQDMASGREQNENAAQQQARQQAKQEQHSETSSLSFLQQMRLGLV